MCEMLTYLHVIDLMCFSILVPDTTTEEERLCVCVSVCVCVYVCVYECVCVCECVCVSLYV